MTWTKIDRVYDATTDGWGDMAWGDDPWGGGDFWTKLTKTTDSWIKLTKVTE